MNPADPLIVAMRVACAGSATSQMPTWLRPTALASRRPSGENAMSPCKLLPMTPTGAGRLRAILGLAGSATFHRNSRSS